MPDHINDLFWLDYPVNYYHFTLYYYDRAGNLVKTVPPLGVDLSKTTRSAHPNHTLITGYEYNSLKWLLQTRTPDGDTTRFWYNNKGQVRFAQSARQYAYRPKRFTYIKYDALGRTIEGGEAMLDTGVNLIQKAYIASYPKFDSAGIIARTLTYYSTPASIGYLADPSRPQRYLLNRVSFSSSFTYNGDGTDDSVSSYFSYDPHGNVEWTMRHIPTFGDRFIRYEYDLFSGNMVQVNYSEGKNDQFLQRYSYDPDNRLLLVESSRDGEIWDRDARYSYYLHGPLRRVELGEDSIQGTDYIYTIQGWLKGINFPKLTSVSFDPGGDAQSGANRNFPRDAFGMMLGYFPGDFERGSSQFNSGGSHTVGAFNLPGRPLFNGNITSWTSETQAAPSGTPGTRKYEQKTGENYRYDVLNRLLESVFSTYAGGHWDTTANHEYSTSYQYDANGNILRLKRNGYNAATLGAPMDDLLYGYQPGTNRLDSVDDTVARNAYPGDQDDQHKHNYRYDASGNMVQDIEDSVVVKWNWQGKIEQIKKRRHPKNDSTASLWGISQTIKYLYDPAGQRIRKEVIEDMDSVHGRVTYYVRDANEQVMAIYEGDWASTNTPQGCGGMIPAMFPKDYDCDNVPDGLDNCPKMSNPLVMGIQMDSDTDGVGNACDPCTGWDPWQEDWDNDGAPDACDNCPANPDPSCINPNVHQPRSQPQIFAAYYVKLSEWHLYGSGAIGLLATVQPDTTIWGDTTTQHDTLYIRRVGYKLFQLQDHLGNVRAIVSDMKYCSPSTPGVRPFTADLRSYINYYPFGQEQPARVWNSDTARYGYNGKEKDDEVAGDGNQYDYGGRIYNPRIGKWMSIDPHAYKHADW
ncbi:MAG: thrombospondin type 3 repeat-containing protein, partial [Bacteroidota bacterium]